jgi:galactokinase
MTARGAQTQRGSRSGLAVYTGQRHRDVLVYPDTGTAITIKEAREDFGALSVVISNSRLASLAQRNFARRRAPNANAAEAHQRTAKTQKRRFFSSPGCGG